MLAPARSRSARTSFAHQTRLPEFTECALNEPTRVERVVKAVIQALEQRDGPVYVRKQIVHNTHVVADLEARGVVFVDELDQVPDNATVVFSAHGVSPVVRQEANRRALDVIDATCPLVTKVHAEARAGLPGAATRWS